jgi:excisionase family DNA binding protein
MNDHANPSQPSARPVEALWTPQQVAEYLSVSRSWVYQKAEAGLIPVIRMPGSSLLRFDPDAIRSYARGEWEPPKVIPFQPSSPRRRAAVRSGGSNG